MLARRLIANRAFRIRNPLEILPGGGGASLVAAGIISGSRGQAVTVTRSGTRYVTNTAGVLVPLGSNLPGIETTGLAVDTSTTNLCLYARDLTNAAWTKTDCTAALTATGADGVVNTASTLTATGTDATCLQAITVASAARTFSVYLKRRTGTGAVSVTRNNGTNWTVATVTSSWTRTTLTTTLANPTVGFKLAVSGDAIDVDFCQDEGRAFASAPILTTTASVTRAADEVTVGNPLVDANTDWSVGVTVTPMSGRTWTVQSSTPFSVGVSGAANSARCDCSSDGVCYFRVFDAASALKARGQSMAAFTAGTTHRITCSNSNGTLQIFFDGVLQAAGDGTTNTGTGVITTMPATIYVGATGGANATLHSFFVAPRAGAPL